MKEGSQGMFTTHSHMSTQRLVHILSYMCPHQVVEGSAHVIKGVLTELLKVVCGCNHSYTCPHRAVEGCMHVITRTHVFMQLLKAMHMKSHTLMQTCLITELSSHNYTMNTSTLQS